jgi:hypothetical protein
VRLEGLSKLERSTSSGLEPATFRLVAQCLNQLRYREMITDLHHLNLKSSETKVFFRNEQRFITW